MEEILFRRGEERRGGTLCWGGHSSRIDAHGKGGVSTFIVTKMSYCLFTRTDTKGGREDNGAFVRVCILTCDAREGKCKV